MDINVLDNNLNKIAVVDYYKSLIWCKRFYEIGAIDIQVEATKETVELFKKGYYITRDDDDAIYIIKAIELTTDAEEGDTLTIGGYDLRKLLEQRIVWNKIVFSGTVENYIRQLITENVINPQNPTRKINNFALAQARGFTETTEQQVSNDNLWEKIEDACRACFYGSKVTLSNGVLYFDLYLGTNRSVDQIIIPQVVFSPEWENIASTKYVYDESEYKNCALVQAEEGAVRLEVGNASGLNRYEIFVDAGNVSEEGTQASYQNALIAKATEELAKTSNTASFEGDVEWLTSYTYKVDYNIGDIVTIKNEYGISINARIIEVAETWDEEGYTIEPKFEYIER